MRNSLIVKYALLNFVAATFSLCANEEQTVAENVIRRAYTSITRIKEGKIFLKPEKLCLKQGIVYVEDISGEGLAIPIVFPSKGRPYMQVGETSIFNLWKCECDAWNHKWDNPSYRWKCGRHR